MMAIALSLLSHSSYTHTNKSCGYVQVPAVGCTMTSMIICISCCEAASASGCTRPLRPLTCTPMAKSRSCTPMAALYMLDRWAASTGIMNTPISLPITCMFKTAIQVAVSLLSHSCVVGWYVHCRHTLIDRHNFSLLLVVLLHICLTWHNMAYTCCFWGTSYVAGRG